MEKYDAEAMIEKNLKRYVEVIKQSIMRTLANKPVAEFIYEVVAQWGPRLYSDEDCAADDNRAYSVYGIDSDNIQLHIYLGGDDEVADIKPVIAAFASNRAFKRTSPLAVNEWDILSTKYHHAEADCEVTLRVELSRSTHCTFETQEIPTGEMVEAHERVEYRKVVVCRDEQGNVVSRTNGEHR